MAAASLAVGDDVKQYRRRSTLDAPAPGSPAFDGKHCAETTPPRARLSGPPSPGLSPMKRPAIPPEVFILVRPPPSSRNHPSNVQIQYVTPAATVDRPPDSRRASVDLGRPSLDSTHGLSRTVSIRSNRSQLSLASSNGSLGDGMAKGQRRVTPLYNLDVHSLLQTVVTDAGTDAKVALFKKRGIEIVNAYELSASGEAVEFTTSPADEDAPDASAPASSASTTDPPGAGNSLLNKLKRFSFKPAKSVDPTQPRPESPVALFRAKSVAPPPAVEGDEAVVAPRQHASGYRWKIRRWLRKPETITLAAATELTASVSVEWRKRKRTVEQRRAARDRRSEAESIAGGMTRTATHLSVAPPSSSRRSSVDLGTRTPDTLASRSPSLHSNARFGGDDNSACGDDDEDSDPEDSESPWQCHLIVPERQERQPSYMSATPPRRILLSSFAPHPYHPKLVGQMAMPADLAAVELDDEGAFALEIEDLKDIVCVTLLHLVIRESLGGIAKRRAGDGAWRIGK